MRHGDATMAVSAKIPAFQARFRSMEIHGISAQLHCARHQYLRPTRIGWACGARMSWNGTPV